MRRSTGAANTGSFPTTFHDEFGFDEKEIPTEQYAFHQDQGWHILRCFSMDGLLNGG